MINTSKKTWTKQTTLKLVLSALCLTLGYVLPFFTGQIQAIGQMLLPMHLPVMLCGLICGWKYGLSVGALLPITRSLIFGMPLLYPNAVAMSFELATYGLVIGLLYTLFQKKHIGVVYISLVSAMVAGRLVWGVAQIVLFALAGNVFTWQVFVAGAISNAIPGMILQLILIPTLMFFFEKAHLLPLQKSSEV